MILLPAVTIAGALANQLSPVIDLGQLAPSVIVMQSKFLYGSGGTSVDAYLQTSFDNQLWMDVMNQQNLLAAKNQISSVSRVAGASALVPITDGSLATGTVKAGIIGRLWRVKWTSVGIYAGLTSLEVDLFWDTDNA